MTGNNSYTRIVAALLFVTVCAYLGAAVWKRSGGDVSVVTSEITTLNETVRLSGIAVRTERSYTADAENASRIPASEENPSGVYFAESDGYEYLSPAALDDIQSLLSSQPREHNGGRLVTENVWYYAAECDAALETGRVYELLFDGAQYPVRATVTSCDGQYAVFRMNVGGEYFLSLRKCEAVLTVSSHSGVKLPAQALHTDGNGKIFVYTCASCVVGCKKVDIIYTDGNNCLVTGIAPGEVVVTAGREIYEGMVIG